MVERWQCMGEMVGAHPENSDPQYVRADDYERLEAALRHMLLHCHECGGDGEWAVLPGVNGIPDTKKCSVCAEPRAALDRSVEP